MIIDCHFHLEEGLLARDELIERMDAAGVDRVALMGAMVEPFPEAAKFLVSLLQFLITRRATRGIAKALVANFSERGNIKLPMGEFKLYPDPDNGAVFEAVKKFPKRFLGWAFVNPRGVNEPVKELARWKKAPGFVGVKVHPFWHRYDPVLLAPVAHELVKTGKPMLAHVGFGSHGDFGALLRAVPGLKLILAHAGFPEYSDTWEKIRGNKNVYVDLSQTGYVGEKTTRQVIEYLGVGRCLFGTDGPFGYHAADGKMDYGFIRRRIERLVPDAGARRRILGENFAELAGIS